MSADTSRVHSLILQTLVVTHAHALSGNGLTKQQLPYLSLDLLLMHPSERLTAFLKAVSVTCGYGGWDILPKHVGPTIQPGSSWYGSGPNGVSEPVSELSCC